MEIPSCTPQCANLRYHLHGYQPPLSKIALADEQQEIVYLTKVTKIPGRHVYPWAKDAEATSFDGGMFILSQRFKLI